MPAATLIYSLGKAIDELREAMDELKECAKQHAETEMDYRRARAISYLQAEGKTVAEKEANAEITRLAGGTLTDIRYRRDLAEGLHESAKLSVKSSQTIVSALQSQIALEKAEAELARWTPSGA